MLGCLLFGKSGFKRPMENGEPSLFLPATTYKLSKTHEPSSPGPIQGFFRRENFHVGRQLIGTQAQVVESAKFGVRRQVAALEFSVRGWFNSVDCLD